MRKRVSRRLPALKEASFVVCAVAVLAGCVITAGASAAPVPGNNGRIVFDSTRDGQLPQIYSMKSDGSGIKRLTDNAGVDKEPSYSPDGSRIVFTSQRDLNNEIYVMNSDGTNQTRLTKAGNPGTNNSQPTFSPDGERIAFVSNRDGPFEIYSMNVDGSKQTRLTDFDGFNNSSPAYSPDGSKIAFTSDHFPSVDIYVMSSAGSPPKQLTTDYGSDRSPAFSPDGSKIVFTSNRDGDKTSDPEVYVMNAGGSSQAPVTANATQEYGPSFSPDGTHLLYHAAPGNHVHVRNLATKVEVVPAAAGGSDEHASWESVSRAPTCQPAALNVTSGLVLKSQVTCSDPDAEPFSVALTSAPLHGSALVDAQGSLTYTPSPGYTGPDQLKFTATDRRGTKSQPALVSITVKPGLAIVPLPPPLPEPPAPPAPDPAPAPAPDGGEPAPTPSGSETPTPAPQVRDTTPPKLKITRLPTSVRRSSAGKLIPWLRCNEACRLSITVRVQRRGRKSETTISSVKTSRLTATVRKVRLRVKASKLNNLKKQRLVIRVLATDAAGNRMSVVRSIRLKR